jgi:hypothetical protein
MYEMQNNASKRRKTLRLGFRYNPNWGPLTIKIANVARVTIIKPNVMLQISRLFFAGSLEK